MPETRSGVGREKKKRRLHSMAQPRMVTLKVFHLGRCSPYSMSDSGQDASVTDAYMRGLHTRR